MQDYETHREAIQGVSTFLCATMSGGSIRRLRTRRPQSASFVLMAGYLNYRLVLTMGYASVALTCPRLFIYKAVRAATPGSYSAGVAHWKSMGGAVYLALFHSQ